MERSLLWMSCFHAIIPATHPLHACCFKLGVYTEQHVLVDVHLSTMTARILQQCPLTLRTLLHETSGTGAELVLKQIASFRYTRGVYLRFPFRLLTDGRPYDFINIAFKAALLAAGYAVISMDFRGTGD